MNRLYASILAAGVFVSIALSPAHASVHLDSLWLIKVDGYTIGTNFGKIAHVLETSDNNVLLVCYRYATAKDTVVILKVNTTGKIEWQTKIPEAPPTTNVFWLREGSDATYQIAGNWKEGGGIISLNANGEIIGEKIVDQQAFKGFHSNPRGGYTALVSGAIGAFDSSVTPPVFRRRDAIFTYDENMNKLAAVDVDVAQDGAEFSDGNFLAVGYFGCSGCGYTSLFRKIDPSGMQLWRREYGRDRTADLAYEYEYRAYHVVEWSGGLMITGVYNNYRASSDCFVFAMKLDDIGRELTEVHADNGYLRASCDDNMVKPTPDGGVVIMQSKRATKFDTAGKEVWRLDLINERGSFIPSTTVAATAMTVATDSGYIFAGWDYGALWLLKTKESTTSIGRPRRMIVGSGRLPSLEQNSGGTLTVRCFVPFDTRVRLDVFDAAGRHLTSAFDARLPRGEREITFAMPQTARGLIVGRLKIGDRSGIVSCLSYRGR